MIILIRHGQTTSNAAQLLVGRSDPALTTVGERQALALRPHLANVRQLWSSPLRRATATAAWALPDLVPVIKESFIELDYGTFDGQHISTMTSDEWAGIVGDHAAPFGGGESLLSLDQRVHAELDVLLQDESSLLHRSDEHLAIVTHMSPVKSAATWALGISGAAAWRMQLHNGSLTTIGARASRPMLVNFNVLAATGL